MQRISLQVRLKKIEAATKKMIQIIVHLLFSPTEKKLYFQNVNASEHSASFVQKLKNGLVGAAQEANNTPKNV